jgi:putative PIN family toxin of toxin-antitoxin system
VLSVTADTNIIISALNFRGNPRRFLEMAEAGEIRLAMSDAIMAEIVDVLGREKFGWSIQDIELAKRQLRRFTQHVEPSRTIDAVKADPDDNRILECAAAAKSDYLVTGDNHLLQLGKFEDVPIVKVADFLKVVRGEGQGTQWSEAQK